MTPLIWIMLAANLGATESPRLDLFANYHTIGVNVRLGAADTERDAWASLEYGSSSDKLTGGFPLSRVDNGFGRLSGSVFWCEPGTNYHIRVTLHDNTTPTLDGVVLTGSIATRAEPDFPSPTKTLYVSPDGSGATFTINQPGNLERAMTSVKAGQRIMLLPGSYYTGNLKLTASGTASAPIQIEGAAGGASVIDGSDPNPPTWKPGGATGLYVSETAMVNPNLVIADGQRLYPHQSLDDLKSNRITVGLAVTKGIVRFDAGLDGFYRNPSGNPLLNSAWRTPRRLYVKFRDNCDPAKKHFKITRYNRGLTISAQSHVRLRNLAFAYYGRAPAGTALHLADCDDIVLDRCTFGPNDIGVKLNGDCRRITIQDCEFYDAMKGWHAWKIKASYDNYQPYSAIFPYYSRMLERGGLLYQHGFRGRGVVIRNVFHSIVPDVFTMRPEDGLRTQPGHPFKFQTGDNVSRIGDLFFIHNTVDAPKEAVGLDLATVTRWKRFYARNNLIVTDKAPVLVVSSRELFPIDIDYNGFHTRRGEVLGRVNRSTQNGGPTKILKRLTDLHRLGWERHGLVSDPQFVAPLKHDYRLQPFSPGVDRGERINGINDRHYFGAAPDMGAVELE